MGKKVDFQVRKARAAVAELVDMRRDMLETENESTVKLGLIAYEGLYNAAHKVTVGVRKGELDIGYLADLYVFACLIASPHAENVEEAVSHIEAPEDLPEEQSPLSAAILIALVQTLIQTCNSDQVYGLFPTLYLVAHHFEAGDEFARQVKQAAETIGAAMFEIVEQ